jgi:high-affinity iron transporter
MDSVGMFPAFVIGVREGIEAALIIGILLAYLTKIGRPELRRYILWGSLAAVVASLAIGGALWAIWGGLDDTAGKAFEGFATLLAVVVLTSMVLWMIRAAQDIRKHFEQKIDFLVDRRQILGLSILAFVAVFREGIETVLFTAAASTQTSGGEAMLAVVGGLTLAAVIGFGIFMMSWKVNLKRFFQVTSVFLVIIAAGLFTYSVHELQEAYGWGLDEPVYDASGVLPDKVAEDSTPTAAAVTGTLLRGIVGYNDKPTQLEAVAYLSYWLFVALVYWGMRTGKIEIVLRPFQTLWRRLTRKPKPAPAQTPRRA